MANHIQTKITLSFVLILLLGLAGPEVYAQKLTKEEKKAAKAKKKSPASSKRRHLF